MNNLSMPVVIVLLVIAVGIALGGRILIRMLSDHFAPEVENMSDSQRERVLKNQKVTEGERWNPEVDEDRRITRRRGEDTEHLPMRGEYLADVRRRAEEAGRRGRAHPSIPVEPVDE